MRLIVFDIDGTLTQTDGIDETCFVRAFQEEFGLTGINTDWGLYSSCTDAAIGRDLLTGRYGREPEPEEIERVRGRFVSLLEAARERDPQDFEEMRGAAEILRRLRAEPDTRLALATGGWGASARLKLQAAGLDTADLPFASSDDAPTREEIVQLAIERSGPGPFERIVAVGNGLWDLKAARNLGLAFVGIASGDRAERLRQEGASHVVEDFGDLEGFLQCLAEAA